MAVDALARQEGIAVDRLQVSDGVDGSVTRVLLPVHRPSRVLASHYNRRRCL